MRYIILGAGPAGLSFAHRIKLAGESFTLLEKEDTAGGLCRSVDVDGSPLDIGGGHFLDTRKPKVNEFLFRFLPEKEWDLYERDSRIEINGETITHPVEANIWQLKVDNQIEYLRSIAAAGCNVGEPMPDRFSAWIFWKLGEKIANDYMIPYNRKMFGDDLDRLGTYWLEKLPNVSFEETLRSCLTRQAYGKQPGHTTFYYPKKYGYGEVWMRMAEKIREHILYNARVVEIDFNAKTVLTADGTKHTADRIITTVPWMEFETFRGMPDDIRNSMSTLKYSSMQTEYYPDSLDTGAYWIYYPDPLLSYHRILVRHNFCPKSRGYWTETNSERVGMPHPPGIFKYMNSYAYPLNTIGKPETMSMLLDWAGTKQVYGLGRWGEHQHFNSDVTVERALRLAETLLEKEI